MDFSGLPVPSGRTVNPPNTTQRSPGPGPLTGPVNPRLRIETLGGYRAPASGYAPSSNKQQTSQYGQSNPTTTTPTPTVRTAAAAIPAPTALAPAPTAAAAASAATHPLQQQLLHGAQQQQQLQQQQYPCDLPSSYFRIISVPSLTTRAHRRIMFQQ